jgi:trimeric autotransporter adhesin
MANLTLRQVKGSALTIAELDGNFEHFTGSYTNTGTITAQGFSGSFTGSLQGTAQTASYVAKLNQNVIISGSLLISGSIIPNTNGISSTSSFNLGSPTNAWKDIYVSNGTINFLDGAGNVQGELSSTANGLSTNGDAYFNEIRIGQGSATGSGNIVVGKNSFLATSSLNRLGNTAIGNEVLTYYIGGSSGINYYNTSVGYFSLSDLTTGGQNTSIGMSALRSATTGYTNTAVGYSSLVSLISGSSNVGVGANALYDLINGYQNTSIGDSSLVSITNGYNNTAVGWFAGRYASASSAGNVYLGFNAGPASNIVQNNKLYINNQYGDPLIGGDFNAKTVTISGSLTITSSLILSNIQSIAPSYTGVNGEIIPAIIGSQYLLYMWINGAWRSSSFA